MQPLVDVVVPVYRDLEVTRRALASVLASRNTTPFELIAIDDATPEPAVASHLDELARAGLVTLVRHADNRGFVASANHGMRLHPERDVVLLNSDTEVSGDWLDRLRAAALSGPRVGTATPLTNSGWICSYPGFPMPGPLPAGTSGAELDALCRVVNAGVRVPIPIGIGFCLYLRRACLDAVGFFDEATFGRGYGEESDFCMRAARRGWMHVLASDVFVHHIGTVSFDKAERQALGESAREAMRQRHPGFRALMRAHVRQDPARAQRLALDVARLAASPRPRVVHVLEPGAPAPSDDAASDTLTLRLGRRRATLAWSRRGETFRLYFQLGPRGTGPDEVLLARVLRAIGVSRIDQIGPIGPIGPIGRIEEPLLPSEHIGLHDLLELVGRPERPGDPPRVLRRALELRHRLLDVLDGQLHGIARRAPRPLRILVRRWLERG